MNSPTTTNKKMNDFDENDRKPFILVFPWLRCFSFLFLLAFLVMFIYRVSATGGEHVERACFAAMVISAISGFIGFYVISETWSQNAHKVFIGVMFALTVRLLTSGVGVAIITVFTSINRSWFIFFLVVYYLAFLSADTLFALWILKNSDMKKQKELLHGNLWDAFG